MAEDMELGFRWALQRCGRSLDSWCSTAVDDGCVMWWCRVSKNRERTRRRDTKVEIGAIGTLMVTAK